MDNLHAPSTCFLQPFVYCVDTNKTKGLPAPITPELLLKPSSALSTELKDNMMPAKCGSYLETELAKTADFPTEIPSKGTIGKLSLGPVCAIHTP